MQNDNLAQTYDIRFNLREGINKSLTNIFNGFLEYPEKCIKAWHVNHHERALSNSDLFITWKPYEPDYDNPESKRYFEKYTLVMHLVERTKTNEGMLVLTDLAEFFNEARKDEVLNAVFKDAIKSSVKEEMGRDAARMIERAIMYPDENMMSGFVLDNILSEYAFPNHFAGYCHLCENKLYKFVDLCYISLGKYNLLNKDMQREVLEELIGLYVVDKNRDVYDDIVKAAKSIPDMFSYGVDGYRVLNENGSLAWELNKLKSLVNKERGNQR